MTVEIYSAEDIDDFDWNTVENGPHLRSYLEPLVRNGSALYIANSQCQVQILVSGGQVFPLILTNPNLKKTSSYVVSNLCQYFDYVKAEVLGSGKYHLAVRLLARTVFPLARKLAQWGGMEKAVYVNNWLFSSNLYPNCTYVKWKEVVEFLSIKFPDRTLIFRSNDEISTPRTMNALEKAGCTPVSARLLYYLDTDETKLKKKRPLQQDRKRWESQDEYTWQTIAELNEVHLSSILNQYATLYLEKHSPYNPHYSATMLRNLHQSRLLDFEGIFEGENLRAVQLVWTRRGVSTTPFIGYDPHIPQEKGLYRHLNTILTNIALYKGTVLNMSSGAGKFKKQRGGTPIFEYNMVYYRHLKRGRRWVWRTLAWAGKRYFQPSMLANDEI